MVLNITLLYRYVSKEQIPADGAFVGLAAPGDVGSWQREAKVYTYMFSFWLINNVEVVL